MDNAQKMFYDFIMERTLEGKQEEMEAVLQDFFKPPQEGEGPSAFQRRVDAVTALLRPEAVMECKRMMDVFGIGDDEPVEIKNPLCQPNRDKWRGHYKDAPKECFSQAFECAKEAHNMQCECWHTGCVLYGDCKKCIVFHLCLRQFPTCQRALLGEMEDHYILFSRDK